MKYILAIFLGCLIYSAQAQNKGDTIKHGFYARYKIDTSMPLPMDSAIIGPHHFYEWGFPEQKAVFILAKIAERQQHVLDSLTHAFQTMHDSLMDMEKRPHFEFGPNLTPGEIWIDPGFWRADTSWHIPPSAFYADGVYLPNETVSDSTLKWWREHGHPLQTGAISASPLFLVTDSTAIRPAPKKKRRKG